MELLNNDVEVLSVTPGTAAANLGKAEDAAHTSGDTGVMALAVRTDTLAASSGTTGDYEALHTDSVGRLYTKAAPMSAIIEQGLTEAVDKDDAAIATNAYSKSVAATLAATASGVIRQVAVYATEVGTGAVLPNACVVYFFDADPTVAAADTALALADWQSCIGHVTVSNWKSDAGGSCAFEECNIAFHSLAAIYVVVQNLGATSWNSDAADDEEVHVNFWYERWS